MPFVMDWNARVTDFIMIIAVLIGPIIAVLITIWAQSRSEKRAAKLNLFIALVAERRQLTTISPTLAKALNTIDVVFADSPKVTALWHKYYVLLSQSYSEERGHTWLELLQAMGVELNYSNLTQTSLDKFYTPQGHVDQYEFQQKLGKQLARVLENTEHLLVVPKKPEQEKGGGK